MAVPALRFHMAGHYVSGMRRMRITLLVAAVVALVSALPAAASTFDVHGDYLDNGVIDQPHSTTDLRDALAAARGDVQYAGLSAAVEDALDHTMLGRANDETAPGAAASSGSNGLGLLPTPRAVDDTGTPPWPLLALSALAAMLAVSGVGSSIYRRLHRRR